MGRDDHKGKSNNSKSLPQTPKNQKIPAPDFNAEIAEEFAALRKSKQKKSEAEIKRKP